jgi:hypothetical protein
MAVVADVRTRRLVADSAGFDAFVASHGSRLRTA